MAWKRTGKGYQSKEPANKKWKPMKRGSVLRAPGSDTAIMERWSNDRYEANVRSYDSCAFGCQYRVIGIGRADQETARDWRDLQYAKNDICGPEWEAFEIFPAESMKKDPSNYYYLYVFPPGTLSGLGFGLPGGRMVVGPKDAIAPQRAFYAGTPK